MSNASNDHSPASKTPSHHAYHVREKKLTAVWTRIGAAWAHADGKGFNIQIDVLPLDGRVTLRVPSDDANSSPKNR